MPKILITNFHPNYGGGHVRYIQSLIDINKTDGYFIGVASPKNSHLYRYLARRSYPFLYACDFPAKIQKELPNILKSIHNFRKIVSDFQPDIVHTNGAADLFIVIWSFPTNTPYLIVRTHHAIRYIPNSIYHRWVYNYKVKMNIYVSQSAFDLSTNGGILPINHTVITNGVDTNLFYPRDKDKDILYRYNINDKCFCFGSCAGTNSYKRVDMIIDAAINLKKDGIRNFRIL